jgi:Holliday junction resolvase RusA-like endonuclease
MQAIKILGIPPTQNQFRQMHHFRIAKEKKYWEWYVQFEVKAQKIKPMQRVKVIYEFHFKDNRRRDADNYSTACKFIQDGLVQAGILQDDNFDIVTELTIRRGECHKNPYIMIYMEET